MKSNAWMPVVYLSVTFGSAVVVLGLVFLLLRLLIPGFSLLGLERGEGKLMVWSACGIAFGTVVVATRLLKRYFGKEFGTYLDDPDADVEGLHATEKKVCLRCGTRFAAFHNECHAAGYCSQGCQKAARR